MLRLSGPSVKDLKLLDRLLISSVTNH
jgi:hypothetical protein